MDIPFPPGIKIARALLWNQCHKDLPLSNLNLGLWPARIEHISRRWGPREGRRVSEVRESYCGVTRGPVSTVKHGRISQRTSIHGTITKLYQFVLARSESCSCGISNLQGRSSKLVITSGQLISANHLINQHLFVDNINRPAI